MTNEKYLKQLDGLDTKYYDVKVQLKISLLVLLQNLTIHQEY